MNCEDLATAERFPPILVRTISVFCSIPAHFNSRIISQIHNSLHYGILIKVWAIWNGMQTATHRNMFASHQDRTPTAVHSQPLWTSCLTTVPRRNLHRLLPSQPSFPARGTPVRKAATTDTQTHTGARMLPVSTWGLARAFIFRAMVSSLRRQVSTLGVGSTSEGKELLEWVSCCLAVHPWASKSSGFPCLPTQLK